MYKKSCFKVLFAVVIIQMWATPVLAAVRGGGDDLEHAGSFLYHLFIDLFQWLL